MAEGARGQYGPRTGRREIFNKASPLPLDPIEDAHKDATYRFQVRLNKFGGLSYAVFITQDRVEEGFHDCLFVRIPIHHQEKLKQLAKVCLIPYLASFKDDGAALKGLKDIALEIGEVLGEFRDEIERLKALKGGSS